jgi:hypothetical protein
MIKFLRPEEVWQPKLGAPRGNRNAFKTGCYASEPRALRKEIAAWKRETRALLAWVAKSPPPCGEADNLERSERFSGGGPLGMATPSLTRNASHFDLPIRGR